MGRDGCGPQSPPVFSCLPLADGIAVLRGTTPPAASFAALHCRGQQAPVECQLPAASPVQRSLTTEQRTKTPVRAIGCWNPAAGRTTQPVRGQPMTGDQLVRAVSSGSPRVSPHATVHQFQPVAAGRGFPSDRGTGSSIVLTVYARGRFGGWATRPRQWPKQHSGLDLDGEFDPGSGRTLAARFIHASRTNPRLRSQWESGERVSNT